MDALRYYVALLIVAALPAALSMWFLIHPFARFWRRRGPALTYLWVVVLAALLGGAIFRFREPLLRVEFGFSWALSALGVVFVAGAIALESGYRRQLKVTTLLGLPEIDRRRSRQLMTGGIYARIRHPRYIGLFLEACAFSLFANYLAAYLVVVALVPILGLIVLLEERELRLSFGEEYRRYERTVPRFIPRCRSPLRRGH